jgi:hypothetical protein
MRLVHVKGATVKAFAAYYLGVVVRPRRTFDALMQDARRLQFGAGALLVTGILYTLVYVFLYVGGAHPTTFRPWRAIPADDYYRYNRFLLAPSLLMCWLLAGGVVQLLGRFFRGSGSFEDTLAALGFGIAVPTWASLVHDLSVSFLGAIRVIDAMEHEAAMNAPTPWRTLLWVSYSAYLVWFLVVFPKAVGAAQRVRSGPAMLVGILGFGVYQSVFLLFNR